MDSLCAGLDNGKKARRNFGKSFASTPITPLPQRLYTLRRTKTKSKQPRPEKQFPKNPLKRTDAGREAATRKMFLDPDPPAYGHRLRGDHSRTTVVHASPQGDCQRTTESRHMVEPKPFSRSWPTAGEVGRPERKEAQR